MAVEYFEKEISECEKHYNGPFIGYISPRGHLIDFSILIGERGHDNWRNPITPIFLRYVSYVVMGDSLEEYKNSNDPLSKSIYENNKYEGFDDFVSRGLTSFNCNESDYDTFLESLHKRAARIKEPVSHRSEYGYLDYDLMDFFEKCYSKRDFFYSLGMVVKVLNEPTILKMYSELLKNRDYTDKDSFYRDYKIITLMSYFKDIMVQYLGYDSIERSILTHDITVMNNLYRFSNGYDFTENPSILTSCTNPNERFFNWLLMDWNVQVLPRMLWDDKEKRFIQSSITPYHQSDEDKMLAEEIALIKKKVPKQDRKEFFRKN